ncbi:MAG: hypothetical protein L3K17_03165 [Thermoplasmata archaeon]|nr:hypothetical protein [Thermoplasmata archaeon]
MPTADDLEVAREDALLQLKIGRTAHYYSVIVSAALAVDGFLVLFLQPNLVSSASGHLASNFFLAFLIGGGLYLALAGLQIKWEAYQLWPWELHFWTTVLSVLLNALLLVFYALITAGVAPFAGFPLIPWFYPLSMLGVGAPLLGMALTWPEWTQRKTISVAASLLPVAVAVVLFLPTDAQTRINGLAYSLLVTAILVQTSGSFLHLISSGTRSHEREVVNAGQSRLFQLANEVRQREESMRLREQKVISREADVDAAESTLRRKLEAESVARAQLQGLEQEIKLTSEDLDHKQEEFATKSAQTNAQARTLEDQESSLALREQEVERDRARLTVRDQQLTDRESETRRKALQLAQKEQELDRRLGAIPEAEGRLESRKQDIERKTADLLRQESELRTREAGGGTASAVGAGAKASEVEQREANLAQLKIALDEQNVVLGRRARQLDQDRQQLAAAQEELAQRESAAVVKDVGAAQRERDAQERAQAADQRRAQYEAAVKKYEGRGVELDRRESELSLRATELARADKLLTQRDALLKSQASQIAADRSTTDRLQRTLSERQRDLESRETDLDVRQVATSGQISAKVASPPASATLGIANVANETLRTPVTQRFPDRLPTGTPRLDDLLLGGLPPRSHVLLLGDPFVGKEVVLYAAIAEGLRRGEDAVLVTAARGPEEVAAQLNLVFPKFGEFERSGKVHWIDASRTPDGAGAAGKTTRRTTAVVGPDDHAGILKALVAAVKQAETGGRPNVRVGFLGLAATLREEDEKAGSVFLQNFVGILKPRSAVALYTLEGGTVSDAQVERLMTRMDGAIRFRQERDKTYLAVAGLNEVASRDWIECRATNKALVLGSFALERIR